MTIRHWVGPVDAGRFHFGPGGVWNGGAATSPDGRHALIGGKLPPGWTPGWRGPSPEEWAEEARAQQARVWGPDSCV